MHKAPDRNKGTSSVDTHVGRRVLLRRKDLGIIGKRYADGAGLSLQRVQEYETGASRASAAELSQIARLLDVSIGYFFDGLVGANTGPAAGRPTF
jgi:transcriptional regulator with XRE-family HTH domain